MPFFAPSAKHSFKVDNFGANPSATPGTSITPGASNAEGTFTQILAALAQECAGFYLQFTGGGTSAAAKPQLADIGIDPAGGSSYTSIINNIVMGASAGITAASCGHKFFFPMRLPAGATVACRIQGANATAGTVRCSIRAYGQPDMPHRLPVGQYAETIGTITNSNGVSFTPGNVADGTWASLGTTARDLWWWQIGYQIDNATITGETTYVEIGQGDGSNKQVIARTMHVGTTAETVARAINTDILWHECYHPVVAGTNLYIRGRCDSAPDTGYNGVAIGIGG